MRKALKSLRKEFSANWILYLMLLPTAIFVIVFAYLPKIGIVMAFQRLDVSMGPFNSPWVGLDNFRYIFATTDAWRITRNTICYNAAFILVNLALSVSVAMVLNEIRNRTLSKVLQTIFIMPYFLSIVVVAMIVFAYLGQQGFVNGVLSSLGLQKHNFYQEAQWWPFFLVFINAWKGVGYSSVVYLATITGISSEYYEAAVLDGASKLQQARYITLPCLKPIIIIMLIMSIGNIFTGDFGLFYTVTRNSTVLYPVTDIIDTYIYRGLTTLNNPGMSTAAGLYQSAVGFALLIASNALVKKIDPENAMF